LPIAGEWDMHDKAAFWHAISDSTRFASCRAMTAIVSPVRPTHCIECLGLIQAKHGLAWEMHALSVLALGLPAGHSS